MTAAQAVREGVENLLRNCVGVEGGESILLLNEKGGVDADLVGLMEEAIVAAVVLKHFSEERCACTADLREQYPPSLLPRTLWVCA